MKLTSIDIDSLLQEISPQAPCGDNLEDEQNFMALQEKAKGIPEKQMGKIIEPAQPPNWKEVRKDLLSLMQKTRDLRLLLIMVRVGLNVDGVVGLQESLELLRRAVVTYWDTLHPRLDPEDGNDPMQRVNILMGLCNEEFVLRSLLNTPLVESRVVGRFSLRDMNIASGKLSASSSEGDAPTPARIQAAFADTDPAILRATRAALGDSLSNVERIENYVTEQVGVSNAPSFAPLRDGLKEALSAFNEQMTRCGLDVEEAIIPEEDSGLSQSALPGAPQAQVVAGQLGGINTRQDVIRAFDLICDYYEKYEPSSPVPLLVKRAKRLANKDFMEILQDLAPDGLNQIQLIKGKDSE